jgi:hypothetical protein
MLDWDDVDEAEWDEALERDEAEQDELEAKISAAILETTGICQSCGHEQHIEDDADADVKCEDCQEYEVCGAAAITA